MISSYGILMAFKCEQLYWQENVIIISHFN